MLAEVNISKLKNGVRVISSRIPHVESLSLGVWVGSGGRHEPASMSGVSHFIEHMLFKGTRKRSSRDISEAIEGRGGYLNAFTQEESTCYYGRVACTEMYRLVDVLGDMYRHSVFDQKELDRERGVIIEEIMMYRDQPQQVVQEMLGEAVWTNHPLGRPLIGSPRSLRAITRERMRVYIRGRYRPGNTVLAFAGQVDHAQCVRETEKHFERLPAGSCPAAVPVRRDVGQTRTAFQQKEIEQTHVAMAFRLFGRTDPRRYALRVLSAILGENMSSRLFRVIRERHGLAYAIHSSIQLFDETGVLAITAGLDRRRFGKAVPLIVGELQKMKQRPPNPAELGRAKDYLTGQIRLGWESTTNQMMWLGDNLLTRNRFIRPDEVIASIQDVTGAEVQELAAWVCRYSRLSFAMVYPEMDSATRGAIERSLGEL